MVDAGARATAGWFEATGFEVFAAAEGCLAEVVASFGPLFSWGFETVV